MRWAAMAAAVILLAGCGGDDPKTPEGLVSALDENGIGLDPATSGQRYFDAVQNICSLEGEFGANLYQGFGHPDNLDGLKRMAVGMEYMCPDYTQKLLLGVESFGGPRVELP